MFVVGVAVTQVSLLFAHSSTDGFGRHSFKFPWKRTTTAAAAAFLVGFVP
jgi:hypothetical protein